MLVLAVVGSVLYGLITQQKSQPPTLTATQITSEIKSTSGTIEQVRDDGSLILTLHLPDNEGGIMQRTATLTDQTPVFRFHMADGLVQTTMIARSDLRAGQNIEIDSDKDMAVNETIGVLQLLVIDF